MAVPDVDDIIEMAEHILEVINKTYDEAAQNNQDISIPERQYYIVGGQGQTVHDKEQVTVSWDQAYSGSPGEDASSPTRCDEPSTLGFIVEIVRKVDSLPPAEDQPLTGTAARPARYASKTTPWEMPTPEGITSDARVQMRDAALLMKAGTRAGEHTTLGRAIVDVSAGAPSGQYQAVIMNFAAAAGLDYTTF